MGLDMYLEGRKYIMEDYRDPDNNETEEGMRLKNKIYDLGYWRKHYDLHRYIVDTFAEGVDECQDIELNQSDLIKLISDIRTMIFIEYRGSISDDDRRQEDLSVFTRALLWLQAREDRCIRSVVYVASW